MGKGYTTTAAPTKHWFRGADSVFVNNDRMYVRNNFDSLCIGLLPSRCRNSTDITGQFIIKTSSYLYIQIIPTCLSGDTILINSDNQIMFDLHKFFSWVLGSYAGS